MRSFFICVQPFAGLLWQPRRTDRLQANEYLLTEKQYFQKMKTAGKRSSYCFKTQSRITVIVHNFIKVIIVIRMLSRS